MIHKPARNPANPPRPAAKSNLEEEMSKVFAEDSTFMLIKKYIIYKMMSSNLFINHALRAMMISYKILGTTITNALINKTAGEIFTSGNSIDTLKKDIHVLAKKKVHGVGNYVVEGLEHMDEGKIEQIFKDMIDSIQAITEND